jgi:hypothetical protein
VAHEDPHMTCGGEDGTGHARLPMMRMTSGGQRDLGQQARRTWAGGRDLGRKVRLTAQGRGWATTVQGEDERRRHENKIRLVLAGGRLGDFGGKSRGY